MIYFIWLGVFNFEEQNQILYILIEKNNRARPDQISESTKYNNPMGYDSVHMYRQK